MANSFDALLDALGAQFDFTFEDASGHLTERIGAHNTAAETALTYGLAGLPEIQKTAVGFNGTTSTSNAASHAAFNFTDGPFTIVVVFKRAGNLGVTNTVVDRGSTTGDAWRVHLSSGNFMFFADSLNGTSIVRNATAITDFAPHVFAATKPGSAGASHAYLDGVLDEVFNVDRVLANSTSSLFIGSDVASLGFFNGTIYRIVGFPSVLTAAQINTITQAALAAGYGYRPVPRASRFVRRPALIRRFQQRIFPSRPGEPAFQNNAFQNDAFQLDPLGAVAFDPATGFPWAMGQDAQQDRGTARLEYDPTEQAWAVGPPRNAVSQSAWTDPQADPAPPPSYDPSEQAWAVGPPQNVVQLSDWVADHRQETVDLTQRWYDGQDGGLAPQPPAATPFDPSTGFPWQPEQDFPDQTQRAYQPDELAFIPEPTTENLAPLWNQGDDAIDRAIRTLDVTEQAWSVGPPANADRLTEWAESQPDVPQAQTFDPTDQPWAIGSPQNVVALTVWPESQPDVAAGQTFDPTDQPYAIRPPTAAPYDPASGFPWSVEDGQQLLDQTERRYDGQDGALGQPPLNVDRLSAFTDPQADPAPPPTFDLAEQAWAVEPPLNVDRLSAWTIESHFADQTVRTYDSQDGTFGQPPTATPFDPAAGFPWTVSDGQQDRSLQPVWTDDQNGALGLVPPTSETVLGGVWNLDSQQDRSTQPVWFDPTDQSYAIGPTLTTNQLAGLWQGADPQQDRSLQPVWYEPEISNVFTSSVTITVIGGRGPDTGAAYNATPYGSATAPLPGGTASGPTPNGSATNPRPQR